MDTEKQRKWIIAFVFYAIILGAAIFFCRACIPVLLPFLIAFLVALLLKPAIRFLHEKCRIHKNVAAIFIVVLFYAVIGFLLALLIINVISTTKSFIVRIPTIYTDKLEPMLYDLSDKLEGFVAKLDPSAAAAYDVLTPRVAGELETILTAGSKRLLTTVTSYAFSVPGFLLNVLIAVIATIFMSVDWKTLKEFVVRQLSQNQLTLLRNVKRQVFATLGKYVRSYALILTITFLEIAIGLSIIGFDKAILIALLIAVFDILPVLGSGMVLFPWLVISLLTGRYMNALGLGILWIIVIIVRNIMEPKIVGDRVGLHPLVTLVSMVVGTFVFGPIGLLGLPVSLAIMQQLNEQGVIHIYRKKNAGTDEETPPEPRDPYRPEPPETYVHMSDDEDIFKDNPNFAK